MFQDAGITRRAFDALADMKVARSSAELDDAVGHVFSDLGLPSFALARFFRSGGKSDVHVLHGRFQPDWAARYITQGYGRSCQIAREMMHQSSPYAWSEVIEKRGLDQVQSRIWNEATEFGLRDGVFTPVKWLDGSLAAVVLAGPDAPRADPLVWTMAEVLSAHYASGARRLLQTCGAGRPMLSPRQRECLAWVRHGKSSGAIAQILGISHQTVDEHISAATAKLGVRTRIQAAVEAALIGLID
jgi:LuxR family quorum-sensing system transcriptional regulator CciR